VLGLAGSTGNIVTQYTYDPFGNTTSSGAASSNTSQYTGRENDGNGLYYYRARYYSPSLHRFISQDPIGFVGGNTNLYAYVGNSPTNLTDASGQSPCLLGAASGVIIYNGYQVWRELDAFMAGRKIPNAGWSGAWNILSGSAQGAMAGCMIGDGAASLFGEGAAEVTSINANNIRFSQTSINGAGDIIESMEANGWVGDPVDVVSMEDGGLTTVDNTRVFAAGETDTEVQAVVYDASDPLPANQVDRFIGPNGEVPSTWGDAVRNRGEIYRLQRWHRMQIRSAKARLWNY